jgi:hypothetical protein
MDLRKKLSLTFGIAFAVYLVFIYCALRMFLAPSFLRLEENQIRGLAVSAGAMLRGEIDNLYDLEAVLAEIHRIPSAVPLIYEQHDFLETAHLDVLYWAEQSGLPQGARAPVFYTGKAFRTLLKKPDELLERFQKLTQTAFEKQSAQKGLLVTEGGILLLSVMPIVSSQPSGVLLVGKWLSAQRVNTLGGYLGCRLSIAPVVGDLPANGLEIGAHKIIYATLMNDLQNIPDIVATVTLERIVAKEGLGVFWFSLVAILLCGLTTFLLLVLMVRVIKTHEP